MRPWRIFPAAASGALCLTLGPLAQPCIRQLTDYRAQQPATAVAPVSGRRQSGFGVAATPPASFAEVHEIKMTANKYEFDPNTITVKKGEKVRLVITALDRDYGFKLEAFGINQKLIKGDPATIEFTADKPGTFPFQCSEYRGMVHRKMKGKVIVEE